MTKPSDDIVASNDAIAAGAASIADIERLMAELQAARDYLQAEGERVRRVNANYAHLAQTASASARVIADSIGKWRIPEQASGHQPPTAIGPSVSPDGETLAGTLEVQPALEKMEQQLTHMTAHPSRGDALKVFSGCPAHDTGAVLDSAHIVFGGRVSPASADMASTKQPVVAATGRLGKDHDAAGRVA